MWNTKDSLAECIPGLLGLRSGVMSNHAIVLLIALVASARRSRTAMCAQEDLLLLLHKRAAWAAAGCQAVQNPRSLDIVFLAELGSLDQLEGPRETGAEQTEMNQALH